MTVQIKQYPSATFELTEDGDFHCNHEEAELEAPCCSGRDNEGNPSCACHGQYSVYCPAFDCDGILDHEVDNLIEALMPEAPDYE